MGRLQMKRAGGEFRLGVSFREAVGIGGQASGRVDRRKMQNEGVEVKSKEREQITRQSARGSVKALSKGGEVRDKGRTPRRKV
eukprot:2803212-Pleurochrysis_carterae.AAC.1